MKEKLVGIYVETPYQLITSINIAKNYLQADGCYLFLMEQYYMTEKKFHIRSTHPFVEGIYYIQDYKEVGALQHHLLRVRGLLKGYPSKDYPNMCCYYKTSPKKMPNFCTLICNKYEVNLAKLYLDVLQRNADVYVIEDGVGDYVNPITKIDSTYKRIYYWPDLFNKAFHEKALQAPVISIKDKTIQTIFSDVFSLAEIEKQKIKNIRCVFFHQPRDRENDPLAEIIHESELTIMNLLKNRFGDSFFIKLHPRDKINIFPEFQKIESSVPWESMIYYIDDPSKLLLVGLTSTTLITAKNTFNLEPYIISTIGMFDYWKQGTSTEFISRMEDVFDYLKKSYDNHSKIIIPKSIKELEAILENF